MPWNHLNHLKSPFWWLNPKRLMFQCLNPTFSLVNLGLPGFIHGSVRLFRRHRVLEQLEQWRDPQGRKWDFWDEPHGRAIHFIFFCFTVQMWKVKTEMAWCAKLLEALVMRCHAILRLCGHGRGTKWSPWSSQDPRTLLDLPPLPTSMLPGWTNQGLSPAMIFETRIDA